MARPTLIVGFIASHQSLFNHYITHQLLTIGCDPLSFNIPWLKEHHGCGEPPFLVPVFPINDGGSPQQAFEIHRVTTADHSPLSSQAHSLAMNHSLTTSHHLAHLETHLETHLSSSVPGPRLAQDAPSTGCSLGRCARQVAQNRLGGISDL